MKNFNIANVLDTEWTCYRDGAFPPGLVPEIIELGLCTVDLRTLKIIKKLSIPVLPQTPVSEYCTELTGWTEAKLRKQGVPLPEALRRLEKHGPKNRLLITDTSDELSAIRTECQRLGLVCPFGQEQLNVSDWFTLLLGETQNVGLSDKLKRLGLSFEGREHRASDDAYNIARLFINLVEKGRLNLISNDKK